MGWFSNSEEEVTKMKEVRRNLQDALDTLVDEEEEMKTNMDAKKEEIEVAQSELQVMKLNLSHKQNEIERTEKALALIQGRRVRNSQ